MAAKRKPDDKTTGQGRNSASRRREADAKRKSAHAEGR